MTTIEEPSIFANIIHQVPSYERARESGKRRPGQSSDEELVLRWYSEASAGDIRPSMTPEQRAWCTEQVAQDLDLSSFLTPEQASVLLDSQLARAILTHRSDILRKALRA